MGGFYSVFKNTDIEKFFVCAVDTPFVMPSAAIEMMEKSEGGRHLCFAKRGWQDRTSICSL